MNYAADVLVVGGGLGGCAAALAAAKLGLRVVLTEETDWIGGQVSTQGVPPDENQWIETSGSTASYRQFRNLVRKYYRDHYPVLPDSGSHPHFNPGKGIVSALTHEPRIAVAALEQMLSFQRCKGNLRILYERKPVACQTGGDRVEAVTFLNHKTLNQETISAPYILDATELGELLPLAKVEYVTGAESQKETGEPHAVSDRAQPANNQAITWCFAMGYDSNASHVIDQPASYAYWRDYVPKLTPAWSGKLLDWTTSHPRTLKPSPRVLFPELWSYRRIVCSEHYSKSEEPFEVTLVNWPQNDYFEGNIMDEPEETVARNLQDAKQLSLSLFYWLQKDAPRPDGGQGYPGLFLCPEAMGTDDGFAKQAYIRESRRIKAVFTVTENHVSEEARGKSGPEFFGDSVGIGSYRIDLHPSTGGNNYIDIASLPFQIPLGSLIPVRVENLLPACKNIGTTHISNGCFRLHPVEWNIGESAGLLAAFCLIQKTSPRQVYENKALLEEYQSLLRDQGIALHWAHLASTR